MPLRAGGAGAPAYKRGGQGGATGGEDLWGTRSLKTDRQAVPKTEGRLE